MPAREESPNTDKIMSMPLVAIATPVYNGAAYLAETMECVQALDYPNLVHIVQDNASTDATPEIIKRFSGRRVPVLSTRSSSTVPMAENWNAVTRRIPADATYFWLLCADDLLAPDAIRKVVQVAESDPNVLLVGCQWRADGLCGEELPKEQNIFAGSDILRRYLRRETMALSGMNVLFRRSLICMETKFYDETLAAADTEANLKACTLGRYGFVHEELVFWRQHENSTTERVSKRSLSFYGDWLVLLDRYFSFALGFDEYLHCRSAFRKHFLRRLLMRRFKPGGKEVWDEHLRTLRLHGDAVTITDFAVALLDWGAHAIGGSRSKVGTPRRHFAGSAAGLHVMPPKF